MVLALVKTGLTAPGASGAVATAAVATAAALVASRANAGVRNSPASVSCRTGHPGSWRAKSLGVMSRCFRSSMLATHALGGTDRDCFCRRLSAAPCHVLRVASAALVQADSFRSPLTDLVGSRPARGS